MRSRCSAHLAKGDLPIILAIVCHKVCHNGESGTLAFHIIRVLFQQDLEAGMADEGCHLGSMA